MATVQYQVMYRYIHPTLKKVCTNLTEKEYSSREKFLKAYNQQNGSTQAQDVSNEQTASNPKYDMLFVFDGVENINSFLGGDVIVDGNKASVVVEKFSRCRGEAWFVATTRPSLNAAMSAARPLVMSLGKQNVKVVKTVPLDIEVKIE